MILGTTPKNAPPSSGYVPSEKMLSSKSPRVRLGMKLVCHRRKKSWSRICTDLHGSSREALRLSVRIRKIRGQFFLPLRLHRLFLSHAPADFALHLAGFLVSIGDHMVAVQDLSIQNLQRQRILHQLLYGALQRPRSKVRVIALREKQFFRSISEFDRDFAIGQQTAHVLEAQFDDF